MSDFKDYYEILQVEREADQQEIRQAYRRLALECHPDQNHTEEAHIRFLLIGEAYQNLIDPTLRGRYNLRYDRAKGLKKNPGTSSQSYELVRRKRMTRYNRTGYAQRVRYRGTTTARNVNFDPSSRPQRPPQSGHFSEAHAERILAEEQSAQVGFKMYGRVLRVIAGGVLIFCLAMILDKAGATRTAEETITSKSDMMWSFSTPGVTRVKTALSTFGIKDEFARHLKEGDRVALVKSPVGKVPVEAFVFRRGWQGPLPVYATRYTGNFALIWILVVVSLVTVFSGRNTEFSAYLGTFSLLLSVVILSVVLT